MQRQCTSEREFVLSRLPVLRHFVVESSTGFHGAYFKEMIHVFSSCGVLLSRARHRRPLGGIEYSAVMR